MNTSMSTSTPYFPLCFSSYEQYRQWRALAIKTRVGASDYCTDCTRQHKRQMIDEDRCLHPKTRFFVDCDGFTEGRRPKCERLMNVKKKGRR